MRNDSMVELQLNCKVGSRVINGSMMDVKSIKKLADDELDLVVNDYLHIEKVNTITFVLPIAKCNHEVCNQESENAHDMHFIVNLNANNVIATWETINTNHDASNVELTDFEGVAKKRVVKPKMCSDVGGWYQFPND